MKVSDIVLETIYKKEAREIKLYISRMIDERIKKEEQFILLSDDIETIKKCKENIKKLKELSYNVYRNVMDFDVDNFFGVLLVAIKKISKNMWKILFQKNKQFLEQLM